MKTVIGVVGQLASGKDICIDILEKLLNIKGYQISDVLKNICDENRIDKTRENLISLGRKLVNEYGDGYLAEVILNNSKDDLLLIGGMRQLGQLDFLTNNSNFILIGITANDFLRFNRLKIRGKFGDPTTFDEFLIIEEMENNQGIQRTSECINKSNYIVKNEGSLSDLESKIISILNKEKLL